MRRHLSNYRAWILGAGGIVLVAALAFAVSATLSAQTESTIGYVDADRIIEGYLIPVLDEPLSKETARLQAEFDAAAEGLGDEEKLNLFNQYQAELDWYKQRLIDEQMPTINDAVAKVAQRHGVSVVLERQVVLYGGVDLTDAVLQELNNRRK
ncbi:MAG TPA: OmpH family outer membrane protein [Limnochordales bacterium]